MTAIQSQSRVVRAVRRVRAISRRNYVEELAVRSDAGLSTLTQRRGWLVPAFIFGLVTTAFIWIAALRFPQAASSVLLNGFDTNSKLVVILVMSIPFAPPFISLFALGNLLFPVSPGAEIAVGLMSTFEHRQKSDRQWLIVIVAAMLGALNCLLLVAALAEATGH